MEVRRSNVLRVTHRSCDECVTLEELYASNRLVFVLFYERSLVSQHRYKTAIVSGFHDACADLRFSHVVCGAVDMVDTDDKAYALKYIDPKTAPAHIVVRDGQPQPTQKRHLERLMERPGDKETILWHLGDILASDASPLSLHISGEAKDPGALRRLLQRHTTTVVVAGASAAGPARAAAQRLVFQGHVPNQVTAPKGKRGKGKDSKRQPGHKPLFFVAASGAETLKAHNLTEGTVCTFVGERQLPNCEHLAPKKLSEDAAAKVLLPAAQSALQEVGAEHHVEETLAADSRSTASVQKKSGKGTKRARRSAADGEL